MSKIREAFENALILNGVTEMPKSGGGMFHAINSVQEEQHEEQNSRSASYAKRNPDAPIMKIGR